MLGAQQTEGNQTPRCPVRIPQILWQRIWWEQIAWSGKASVWLGCSKKQTEGMSSDSDVGLRPVKGEGLEGPGRKGLRPQYSGEKVLARPLGSPQAKDAHDRIGPVPVPLTY